MPIHFQPVAVDVVLVRPRNPLNIGAVARAMANFGFSDLIVVNPYDPVWRNARSAVDSEVVLQQARCVATLSEALANATFVLGTGSLEARKPEQGVVQLRDAGPITQQILTTGGRLAIVFGPEKHGLTREDLSWCHHLIEIPTSFLQPSMNLGQAVAVCLYELSAHLQAIPTSVMAPNAAVQIDRLAEEGNDSPESSDLDRFAVLVEQVMSASAYSPKGMEEANRHDLRIALRRMAFTRRDLRRALRLFRRVLHALNR